MPIPLFDVVGNPIPPGRVARTITENFMDWPQQLKGSPLNITAVSGTTNPTCTASQAHSFRTGQMVYITNPGGISGIAGQWSIIVLSSTTFTVCGATASGTWSSNGTVGISPSYQWLISSGTPSTDWPGFTTTSFGFTLTAAITSGTAVLFGPTFDTSTFNSSIQAVELKLSGLNFDTAATSAKVHFTFGFNESGGTTGGAWYDQGSSATQGSLVWGAASSPPSTAIGYDMLSTNIRAQTHRNVSLLINQVTQVAYLMQDDQVVAAVPGTLVEANNITPFISMSNSDSSTHSWSVQKLDFTVYSN